MLFYLLLFLVYSEEVELECGETTYCYLDGNKLMIQPAINETTNKPITDTDLVLGSIQKGSNTITGFIDIQFIANPYENDDVEHEFVAIGDYAFNNLNQNLNSIIIPKTVKSIGSYAFNSCLLSNINIPKSVEVIGESCFSLCGHLDTITFASDCELKSINANAFEGCPISALILPKNVSSVGKFCFVMCGKLRSVTIPASLTSIGEYCFDGCNDLRELIDYSSFGNIGTYLPNMLPAFIYIQVIRKN